VKDKGLKLDEMKASRTLGGAVECRVQGRGKWRGCRCYSDESGDLEGIYKDITRNTVYVVE